MKIVCLDNLKVRNAIIYTRPIFTLHRSLWLQSTKANVPHWPDSVVKHAIRGDNTEKRILQERKKEQQKKTYVQAQQSFRRLLFGVC